LAAVKAIIERYNTSTIILSGDSAGGALTIDVVRQLCIQKREYKKIRGLILLSPWVDPLTKLGSMVTNQANDYLSSHFVNRSLDAVLNGQSAESERINFTQMDLSMLPRTLIQCGSGEVFFDQIQTFSERLKQQGVNCTLQNFVVQCHVFQVLLAISLISYTNLKTGTQPIFLMPHGPHQMN